MSKNTMKICKHCGAEIAASAKTCPQCGGKNSKPIYKRVWFWILIALIVIGIIGMGAGSGDSDTAPASGDTQSEEPAAAAEEPAVEYTTVTVGDLNAALENNPAAASDEYKGKYVELTGKLNNIDSDGSYLSLTDPNDEWDIMGVTCYIKNDEQLSAVKEMSIGQEVTVKGKITDVGEVLGYYLNIDSIE